MNKFFIILSIFVFFYCSQSVKGQDVMDSEENSEDVQEEVPVTTTTTTTTEEPWNGMDEISAGPHRFYYENGNQPKFLMEVDTGIELTLKYNNEKVDTFILDKKAEGGITGSKISNAIDDEMDPDAKRIIFEDYRLNLDYKTTRFIGQNGRDLSGIMLTFNFERKGNSWKMTELEVVGVSVREAGAGYHNLVMGAKTIDGDAVTAPIGLSFSCSSGFKSNSSQIVSGSIKFPGWRMQVFEVRRGKFGPMWECGELMSIGLWVGLLVSLGFAIICAWGFSMLASINTMDRFDDPKGKTIHIPQTSD